ncbi:hypothetical protein C8R47DRAFT_1067783 [Mycena vitilis]|nr:hypothetical protein C8R47DRAFT_1067783 [Mycena vitilis]
MWRSGRERTLGIGRLGHFSRRCAPASTRNVAGSGCSATQRVHVLKETKPGVVYPGERRPGASSAYGPACIQKRLGVKNHVIQRITGVCINPTDCYETRSLDNRNDRESLRLDTVLARIRRYNNLPAPLREDGLLRRGNYRGLGEHCAVVLFRLNRTAQVRSRYPNEKLFHGVQKVRLPESAKLCENGGEADKARRSIRAFSHAR